MCYLLDEALRLMLVTQISVVALVSPTEECSESTATTTPTALPSHQSSPAESPANRPEILVTVRRRE
jgi:hypothetical protein